MIISKFEDYKGNIQTQYDKEPTDSNDDMIRKIVYPNKVVACNLFTQITIKELRKYEVLSIVNYSDMKYTSVFIGEKVKEA